MSFFESIPIAFLNCSRIGTFSNFSYVSRMIQNFLKLWNNLRELSESQCESILRREFDRHETNFLTTTVLLLTRAPQTLQQPGAHYLLAISRALPSNSWELKKMLLVQSKLKWDSIQTGGVLSKKLNIWHVRKLKFAVHSYK